MMLWLQILLTLLIIEIILFVLIVIYMLVNYEKDFWCMTFSIFGILNGFFIFVVGIVVAIIFIWR